MIETNTAFSETAYDCTHCGGIIMKRIDQETGQADRVCHQCDQCGCQWSLSGEILRIGHSPNCRVAMEQAKGDELLSKWPTLLSKAWPRTVWVYVGIAVIAFLFLARFGLLGLAVRLLLPLAAVALIGWFIWQTVKSRP